MIRVVLADDQELVRQGVAVLVEGEGDIAVVGTAADGLDAVLQVREHRPDVVMMDVRMPGMDGIEATRRVLAEHPEVRVLVLTTYEQEDYVYAALRAGASGFLAKDVPPDRLRDAVRTVHDGQSLLSPRATRALVEAYVGSDDGADLDDSPLETLTVRERELLGWCGRGLSNEEIGARLHLSPTTVKTHLNRAMTKLGVHDRAQLVVVSYETGLVRPGG